MSRDIDLTGQERHFSETEIIVSKTDERGRLVYVNDVFIDVGGYSEPELLGQPHSVVRHPHMPRCVFKLMWDTIQSGREIFAYVLNRAKNGDHYWVFAHVTPNFGADDTIVGYHSNRRLPNRAALAVIQPLYADLLSVQESEASPKAGLDASMEHLKHYLAAKDGGYDRFVLSL